MCFNIKRTVQPSNNKLLCKYFHLYLQSLPLLLARSHSCFYFGSFKKKQLFKVILKFSARVPRLRPEAERVAAAFLPCGGSVFRRSPAELGVEGEFAWLP